MQIIGIWLPYLMLVLLYIYRSRALGEPRGQNQKREYWREIDRMQYAMLWGGLIEFIASVVYITNR